ncbi:hypothetical protein BH20VER1_BH20VER1_14740 [soil metagenome]
MEPVIKRRAGTQPIDAALACYLRQKDWRSVAVRDVVRCAWGEWGAARWCAGAVAAGVLKSQLSECGMS